MRHTQMGRGTDYFLQNRLATKQSAEKAQRKDSSEGPLGSDGRHSSESYELNFADNPLSRDVDHSKDIKLETLRSSTYMGGGQNWQYDSKPKLSVQPIPINQSFPSLKVGSSPRKNGPTSREDFDELFQMADSKSVIKQRERQQPMIGVKMDYGGSYESTTRKQPKISNRTYEPPSKANSLNNDGSYQYMQAMKNKYSTKQDPGIYFDPTAPSSQNVEGRSSPMGPTQKMSEEELYRLQQHMQHQQEVAQDRKSAKTYKNKIDFPETPGITMGKKDPSSIQSILNSNFEDRGYSSSTKSGAPLFFDHTRSEMQFDPVYNRMDSDTVLNQCKMGLEQTNKKQQNQQNFFFNHQQIMNQGSFNPKGYGTIPDQPPAVSNLKIGLFYESPSKYLSLKRISKHITSFDHMNDSGANSGLANRKQVSTLGSSKIIEQNQPTQSLYRNSPAKPPSTYSLKEWFESLMVYERSIALTIIDQDLVDLVRKLYAFRVDHMGLFVYKSTQTFKEVQGGVEQVVKDVYFQRVDPLESRMSFKDKFQEGELEILNNIRIVEIDNKEAITLSKHLLENTEFFLNQFTTLDPAFLHSPLKVESAEPKEVCKNSIAYPADRFPAQPTGTTKGPRAKRNDYFKMHEREEAHGGVTRVPDTDFLLPSAIRKPEKTLKSKEVIRNKGQIAFGHILAHLFEKAINVQFLDFQEKLLERQKSFFFGENEACETQNWDLAKYWVQLSEVGRTQFWAKLYDPMSFNEKLVNPIKEHWIYEQKDLEEIEEESQSDSSSKQPTLCSRHMKSKYSYPDDEESAFKKTTTLNKPCRGLKALDQESDGSNEISDPFFAGYNNSDYEDDMASDFLPVDSTPIKDAFYGHHERREVFQKYDEENKISDQQTDEQKKEQNLLKKVTVILDEIKRAAAKIPNNKDSQEEAFMFIRKIKAYKELTFTPNLKEMKASSASGTPSKNLLTNLIQMKAHEYVFELIQASHIESIEQTFDALYNIDEGQAQKKKKKKKNKKAAEETKVAPASIEASQAAPEPTQAITQLPLIETAPEAGEAGEDQAEAPGRKRQRKNKKSKRGKKKKEEEEEATPEFPTEGPSDQPLEEPAGEPEQMAQPADPSAEARCGQSYTSSIKQDLKQIDVSKAELELLKKQNEEMMAFDEEHVKALKRQYNISSSNNSEHMEERMGLLSGEYQPSKYPDMDDKKLTRSEEKTNKMAMEEFELDAKKNLQMFEVPSSPFQEGLRRRSPEEIQHEKNNLKWDPLQTSYNESILKQSETVMQFHDLNKEATELYSRIQFSDVDKARQQQKMNDKIFDYREEIKDEEVPIDPLTGEEQKKKKKKRKKKAKKKTQEEAQQDAATLEDQVDQEINKVNEEKEDTVDEGDKAEDPIFGKTDLLEDKEDSGKDQKDEDIDQYFDDEFYEDPSLKKIIEDTPEVADAEAQQLDQAAEAADAQSDPGAEDPEHTVDPVYVISDAVQDEKQPSVNAKAELETEPAGPTVSKKAQAKKDKKREAKLKKKQNVLEQKQKELEEKEQKKARQAQKRKETLDQRALQQQQQQHKKEEEEVKAQESQASSILQTFSQPEHVVLPGLNELNNNENTSRLQKVFFEKNESYDDSKVPKRGSSRGTSLGSSVHKNKEEEQDLVNNLDEFFPKQTIDPSASTNQKIRESLSNSKKTSHESSTAKGRDERSTDQQVQSLQKRLEEMAKSQSSDQLIRSHSSEVKRDHNRSASSNPKPQFNSLIDNKLIAPSDTSVEEKTPASAPPKDEKPEKKKQKKKAGASKLQAPIDETPLPQIQVIKPDPPVKQSKTSKKKKAAASSTPAAGGPQATASVPAGPTAPSTGGASQNAGSSSQASAQKKEESKIPEATKPLTKGEKKKLKQLAKKQEKEEAAAQAEEITITASQAASGMPAQPQQQDQVTTEVRLEVKILTVQQKQVVESTPGAEAPAIQRSPSQTKGNGESSASAAVGSLVQAPTTQPTAPQISNAQPSQMPQPTAMNMPNQQQMNPMQQQFYMYGQLTQMSGQVNNNQNPNQMNNLNFAAFQNMQNQMAYMQQQQQQQQAGFQPMQPHPQLNFMPNFMLNQGMQGFPQMNQAQGGNPMMNQQQNMQQFMNFQNRSTPPKMFPQQMNMQQMGPQQMPFQFPMMQGQNQQFMQPYNFQQQVQQQRQQQPGTQFKQGKETPPIFHIMNNNVQQYKRMHGQEDSESDSKSNTSTPPIPKQITSQPMASSPMQGNVPMNPTMGAMAQSQIGNKPQSSMTPPTIANMNMMTPNMNSTQSASGATFNPSPQQMSQQPKQQQMPFQMPQGTPQMGQGLTQQQQQHLMWQQQFNPQQQQFQKPQQQQFKSTLEMNEQYSKMLQMQNQQFMQMQDQIMRWSKDEESKKAQPDAQQQWQNSFNPKNMLQGRYMDGNHLSAQEQHSFKLRQLEANGYVWNKNEQDLLSQLSLNELEFVHQFYEVLDSQILKLKSDQEIKLQKTQRLRELAYDIVKDKILQYYKNRKSSSLVPEEQIEPTIEIFGSMATGLAIDASDLDIIVSNFIGKNSPRFQQLCRQELILEMQDLHKELNDVFALKTNTLIESAKVPVIKLQINLVKLFERELSKKSNFTQAQRDTLTAETFVDSECKVLHVDITLDEPRRSENGSYLEGYHEHMGVQCCKYIKQRLEEYPHLKTLVLVFKKFLSLKNLNKPFSGGLSSYSLIQMILAVLKEEESFNVNKSWSIGLVFKHLILEFGYQFSPQSKGIGQDARFHDKQHLNYIFHNTTCNINQQEKNPKQSEFSYDPFQLDPNTCTCGYSSYSKPSFQKSEFGGQKDNDIMQMIQNLVTPQEEESRTNWQSQQSLVIVDPLNKFNNIGKSSYNFQVVQQELRACYQRLSQELINFVKLASKKKAFKAEGESVQEAPAVEDQDAIDGLIPRIFQVEYQMMQSTDHEESGLSLFPAEETKEEPSKAAKKKEGKKKAKKQK